MTQPIWKCVAQLGDRQPLHNGGVWVFVDTTGVYDPELEVLTVSYKSVGEYGIYRFVMETCTYVNGILSDNKFHPEHPAWFADKLSALGSFVGAAEEQLIAWFLSEDPCERYLAWMAVADYFGLHELDSYPLTTYTAQEIEDRYEDDRYNIKENET